MVRKKSIKLKKRKFNKLIHEYDDETLRNAFLKPIFKEYYRSDDGKWYYYDTNKPVSEKTRNLLDAFYYAFLFYYYYKNKPMLLIERYPKHKKQVFKFIKNKVFKNFSKYDYKELFKEENFKYYSYKRWLFKLAFHDILKPVFYHINIKFEGITEDEK